MARRTAGTITFTTLRTQVNLTAAAAANLLPVLHGAKATGAANRFPAEIVLRVTAENAEAVRQVVADLDAAGFIGNYEAQGLWREVDLFERGTLEAVTLQTQVMPTAAEFEALIPILESLEACGAVDRFPMELILHLTRENMEGVREVLASLEQTGLVSPRMIQRLASEVERFESVVFR